MEQWEDIKGYEGIYQVSNIGEIKKLETKMPMPYGGFRLDKEKILVKAVCKKGYYNIGLSKSNKKSSYKVHRLVALAFIPNPENKPQVNHKNGVKTDNCVGNLEWCTGSENVKHSYKNGLSDNVLKAASKKVIDTSNGKIYKSCTDAANVLGISKTTLSHKLCGIDNNNTTFKYLL